MTKRGIIRIIVGILYLMAIPGFALIYSAKPPSAFYNSTLVHEEAFSESLTDLKRRIRDNIYKQWNETVTDHHRRDRVGRKQTSWLIDFGNTDNIEISPSGVTLVQHLTITQDLSKRNNEIAIEISYLTAKVSFDLTESPENQGLFEDYSAVGNFTFDLIAGNPPENVKPFEIQGAAFPATRLEKLPIPKDLLESIKIYASATNGVDIKATERFSRMFYFSAVTITTLGYGDIVPNVYRDKVLGGRRSNSRSSSNWHFLKHIGV
jgi:hypothetical protein